MTSSAVPIRQPRGPSSSISFGSSPALSDSTSVGNASGPPQADQDSLRRANSVSTPRHQVSASISSTPAASSAFHGNKIGRPGYNRYRSGSLTSAPKDVGLVRRKSGRDREVQYEEVLIEGGEEGTTVEGGHGWSAGSGGATGLNRQSSLPSRRGMRPSISAMPPPPLPDRLSSGSTGGNAAPPPRPPRRTHVSAEEGISPPPMAPLHVPSHSLSSLAMFNKPVNTLPSPEEQQANVISGLSRTQSLRAQAKHADNSVLGRSSSLKSTGEHHHRPTLSVSSITSPPTNPNTPRHPFTPPTPPPVSSTAALPPFHLPLPDSQSSGDVGADVKRHQSLNQGYGRVRERLERVPTLLPLEQRQDVHQRLGEPAPILPGGHQRKISEATEDEPPLSPIGRSVWSPATVATGDDGWSRQNVLQQQQQLQDAFEAMQLGRRMMGGDMTPRPGEERQTSIAEILTNNAQHPQEAKVNGRQRAGSEEPSWVANLIGDGRSPQRPHSGQANPPWQDREGFARSQGPNLAPQHQPWQGSGAFGNQAQPMPYLQQQQQMLAGGYGNLLAGGAFKQPGGMSGLNVNLNLSSMGYQQPYPSQPLQQLQPQQLNAHPGFNMPYATPPPSAMMPQIIHHPSLQDQAVIELAKSKGLNPATFDCRPQQARFFVIKSYTEDDVQKSLKHEIWSSTVLGNKRLNGAFLESGENMPIYLFFSVNGSRHFCGVAQMLTPVDESKTSTVWAQDKWKGIFRVKWIFVRDVPTAALRHIRLLNTPEQKPITNSRDTQELHYEAGCEVLQIFLDHQTKSKTSLLQDFAYYEQLSASRAIGQPSPQSAPSPMPLSISPAPPAQPYVPSPSPHLPMGISVGQVPPVPSIPARFR